MNEIQYISYEEALVVYQKTIQKSGGGFAGIRDKGGIESVLDLKFSPFWGIDGCGYYKYLCGRYFWY